MRKPVDRTHTLLKRVSGNFVWAFLAEGSAKGAIFFLTVHLASTLGVANFGIFSFAFTLFTVLWMGVDLGLGMYGAREIARRSTHRDILFGTLSLMRVIAALVIAVGTLVIVHLLGEQSIPIPLVMIFCMYLLARAAYADWFLKGEERYRRLAVISFGVAFTMLCTAYIFIQEPDDLEWSSLPWLTGYGVGALVLWLRMIKGARGQLKFVLDWRQWSTHWLESIHFTLSNGVSTLYQNLPLLTLYAVGDATATGEFAAPFRLVIAGVFVMSILPMALYPVIADLYQRRTQNLKKMVTISALLIVTTATIVAIAVWFFAQTIVEQLFGQEFERSVLVLKVLLLFFVARSVRAVYVRTVCAAGFQREYSKVAFFALLALTIALIVIKYLSLPMLISTCVTLVVIEICMLAVMMCLTHRVLRARIKEVT